MHQCYLTRTTDTWIRTTNALWPFSLHAGRAFCYVYGVIQSDYCNIYGVMSEIFRNVVG